MQTLRIFQKRTKLRAPGWCVISGVRKSVRRAVPKMKRSPK